MGVKELRRSQIINTGAPGSLVEISGESFLVTTIEKWKGPEMVPCELPRLVNYLRRSGYPDLRTFKQPKLESSRFGFGATNRPVVSLYRFPRWLFCQKCRRMHQWTLDDERNMKPWHKPKCKTLHGTRACKGTMVPMRFVTVCENGHIADIEWEKFTHGSLAPQCNHTSLTGGLYFKSNPNLGTGHGALFIHCKGCNVKKSLEDITKNHGLGALSTCGQGRQAWQYWDDAVPCDCDRHVIQRHASNLHYPVEISALDIPNSVSTATSQADDEIQTIRNRCQTILDQISAFISDGDEDFADVMISNLAETDSIPIETIRSLVYPDEAISGDPIEPEMVEDQVKSDEYPALKNPDDINNKNFVGTSYVPSVEDFGSQSLVELISSISLLTRLRNVRVFKGFHRWLRRTDDLLVKPSLSDTLHKDWLPAYEVYGEGIFIDFNYQKLELLDAALPEKEKEHSEKLKNRLEVNSCNFLPEPNRIFIALHSLSHLLIKQLCFECGYASASLRERLYVDCHQKRSGILIYTADGDSEGTLGGLVRQGESDILPNVIKRALHEASWCSSDPLCIEGENQGLLGLNRAACHACLLVSETSCECANALLDRRLLIGDNVPECRGYFDEVMKESGIR